MCPFCIGSAALMAGKLMSAGGLTAFLGKKLAVKTRTKVTSSKNVAEGENHGSQSSKGRDEDALPFTMAWLRHHDRYSDGYLSDANKPYWPAIAQGPVSDGGEHRRS
jgi:hypothetical protein